MSLGVLENRKPGHQASQRSQPWKSTPQFLFCSTCSVLPTTKTKTKHGRKQLMAVTGSPGERAHQDIWVTLIEVLTMADGSGHVHQWVQKWPARHTKGLCSTSNTRHLRGPSRDEQVSRIDHSHMWKRLAKTDWLVEERVNTPSSQWLLDTEGSPGLWDLVTCPWKV